MKYLKKTKLYELAKKYIGDDMPKIKDCNYDFYSGSEMLCFTGKESYAYYQVGSQDCGGWINIVKKNDSMIVDDIYAEGSPETGYEYHSHKEYARTA